VKEKACGARQRLFDHPSSSLKLTRKMRKSKQGKNQRKKKKKTKKKKKKKKEKKKKEERDTFLEATGVGMAVTEREENN